MHESCDVVVVGFGAAGLSAALGAIDAGVAREMRDLRIVVLERATREDRGGNTRWSTATFRMKDPVTLNDDFESAFESRTVEAGAYVATLAQKATDTIAWTIEKGLVFNPNPDLYLNSDDPRIWPEGAGAAIVEVLGRHVEDAARGRFFGTDGTLAIGVEIRYETTATSLEFDADGNIAAIGVTTTDGDSESIPTKTVVLASGGFQGNAEMMNEHVGFFVPPISSGGRHDRGEGIQMALEAGARATGQWDEYHPLPADPRTSDSGLMTFAAVMQTVPYAVLVNLDADRFVDEGADSMDHLYDIVGRSVQRQPRQTSFAIFDSRVFDIPGYAKAVSKDMVYEPLCADSITGLADLLEIDPLALQTTIDAFNAATPADGIGYDPTAKDGVATSGLEPPKSNWALPVDKPPFYAYPVTCAGVFTFGGIGTNELAEVVDDAGDPIPGLYAAGEMTGLYHGDYVGATSVLRSLVFGKIAGERAVDFALGAG